MNELSSDLDKLGLELKAQKKKKKKYKNLRTKEEILNLLKKKLQLFQNKYDNNIQIKDNHFYDDKAFNRLKELQILYKKESALKELFTQTSEKIKRNINQYSIDIYKKKLEVQNILQKINSKNSDQEKKK